MAFGQERLLVTPLQMAMVAGTIGNDGILMRPYVVEKTVTPNGKTRTRTRPTKIRRAVSPATARDVGDDDDARPSRRAPAPRPRSPGLEIGGKTGTAETGVDGEQHDLVHRVRRRPRARSRSSPSPSCSRISRSTGGATAAPIARQVMQALLTPTANP